MLFITEDEELDYNNKICCLYFYANWMPFHSRMTKMLNKMEEKYKNISFFAIDTDYFKSIVKRFEINSIPELIFLDNGKRLKRTNGLILTSALKSILNSIGERK